MNFNWNRLAISTERCWSFISAKIRILKRKWKIRYYKFILFFFFFVFFFWNRRWCWLQKCILFSKRSNIKKFCKNMQILQISVCRFEYLMSFDLLQKNIYIYSSDPYKNKPILKFENNWKIIRPIIFALKVYMIKI